MTVDGAPKMFCGSCGTDVTTPNHAGIYPCGKCGGTSRVGVERVSTICGWSLAAPYACINAPGHIGPHYMQVVP